MSRLNSTCLSSGGRTYFDVLQLFLPLHELAIIVNYLKNNMEENYDVTLIPTDMNITQNQAW